MFQKVRVSVCFTSLRMSDSFTSLQMSASFTSLKCLLTAPNGNLFLQVPMCTLCVKDVFVVKYFKKLNTTRCCEVLPEPEVGVGGRLLLISEKMTNKLAYCTDLIYIFVSNGSCQLTCPDPV